MSINSSLDIVFRVCLKRSFPAPLVAWPVHFLTWFWFPQIVPRSGTEGHLFVSFMNSAQKQTAAENTFKSSVMCQSWEELGGECQRANRQRLPADITSPLLKLPLIKIIANPGSKRNKNPTKSLSTRCFLKKQMKSLHPYLVQDYQAIKPDTTQQKRQLTLQTVCTWLVPIAGAVGDGWEFHWQSSGLWVNKLQSMTDQVQSRAKNCTRSHTAITASSAQPTASWNSSLIQSMPSCKPQAASQYWPVLFTGCLVHHSRAAKQGGENKTAQSKKFKKCTNLRTEIRKRTLPSRKGPWGCLIYLAKRFVNDKQAKLEWVNLPKLQSSRRSCRGGSTALPQCPTCSAGRSFDGPRWVHPGWRCRGNGGCNTHRHKGAASHGTELKTPSSHGAHSLVSTGTRTKRREAFHKTSENTIPENATFDYILQNWEQNTTPQQRQDTVKVDRICKCNR